MERDLSKIFRWQDRYAHKRNESLSMDEQQLNDSYELCKNESEKWFKEKKENFKKLFLELENCDNVNDCRNILKGILWEVQRADPGCLKDEDPPLLIKGNIERIEFPTHKVELYEYSFKIPYGIVE